MERREEKGGLERGGAQKSYLSSPGGGAKRVGSFLRQWREEKQGVYQGMVYLLRTGQAPRAPSQPEGEKAFLRVSRVNTKTGSYVDLNKK